MQEDDVVTFLSEHGFSVIEIYPYSHGVASRNLRVVCENNLDLTVRCDFRRPLEMVRQDRIYSDLARVRGIAAPSGPWIDDIVGGIAVTIRPTIPGVSIAEIGSFDLPEPGRIGRLLAEVHKLKPPIDDRRFFYAGLLDASDPIWSKFDVALESFSNNRALHELILFALAQFSSLQQLRASLCGPSCVMHGDFNPPNILVSNEGLVLIDWEKACAGYPLADLVQAIYYFSACYGMNNRLFIGDFLKEYAKCHKIEPSVLDLWLCCFPAFIFLRDVVSAWTEATVPTRSGEFGKFRRYLINDSAPRFRYFVQHQPAIRKAACSAL